MKKLIPLLFLALLMSCQQDEPQSQQDNFSVSESQEPLSEDLINPGQRVPSNGSACTWSRGFLATSALSRPPDQYTMRSIVSLTPQPVTTWGGPDPQNLGLTNSQTVTFKTKNVGPPTGMHYKVSINNGSSWIVVSPGLEYNWTMTIPGTGCGGGPGNVITKNFWVKVSNCGIPNVSGTAYCAAGQHEGRLTTTIVSISAGDAYIAAGSYGPGLGQCNNAPCSAPL